MEGNQEKHGRQDCLVSFAILLKSVAFPLIRLIESSLLGMGEGDNFPNVNFL